MTETKTDNYDDIFKNDPAFNRGRIEFEAELNALLETNTWPEIIAIISENESKAE